MLQQLTDEFYPLFEERQVQCQLQLKEGVMIEADADKLARVFDNLLRKHWPIATAAAILKSSYRKMPAGWS